MAVASCAACLRKEGHQVDCLDLAVDPAPEPFPARELIAISAPMHTALRIGIEAAAAFRRSCPGAHITFFGYYGWLHADTLLGEGIADSAVGGEPEASLARLAVRIARTLEPVPAAAVAGTDSSRGAAGAAPSRPETDLPGIRFADPGTGSPLPNLVRPAYPVPDRSGLPSLDRYARYQEDGRRILAGAVETTRGCKVECTHCPIPPVYGGRFLVVPLDVVLEDIARLTAAGAGHITFADPDFLNGPGHAVKVVREMHARFPRLTFDFTARVRHLLDQQDLLPELAACGARFAVSAVETLSGKVLEILDKGHTPEEARHAVRLLAGHGISLRPSLLPFTPWSTLADYRELLEWVEEENLAYQVDPVQFSIRLLVPPGSLLLPHPAYRPFLQPLDPARLYHPWIHPDPAMDRLQRTVAGIVEQAACSKEDPDRTFLRIRNAFTEVSGTPLPPTRELPARVSAPPPRMTEDWFC